MQQQQVTTTTTTNDQVVVVVVACCCCIQYRLVLMLALTFAALALGQLALCGGQWWW